jgi:hypothetical protein
MLISVANLVRCSERERRSGIQEAVEDPTSVWDRVPLPKRREGPSFL